MDINSELKDAQLEILDADNTYSANRKGLIWFNRTTDKVKAIFNSAIKILATEEYVDNEISTSETNLENNGLITSERSDPATPASGKFHIYAQSNELYTRNDAGDVNRIARASEPKVVDMYTVKVNISAGPATSSGATLFTVPTGYSWSFVGEGSVAIFLGSGVSFNFDGITYSSGSLFVGDGSNTGAIQATWTSGFIQHSFTGIATIYKKQ